MDMEEVWRPVVGYEGLYEVSSLGNVRSLPNNRHKEPLLLTQAVHWKGYLRVALRKKGERKYKRVHRLVAEAFIPNPENKPTVNHKDGQRSNNCLDNLEWATMSENKHHSIDKLGARPWNENVRRVKCIETGEVYCSATYASKMTGVSVFMILQCCRNPQKTARGYHWGFVS